MKKESWLSLLATILTLLLIIACTRETVVTVENANTDSELTLRCTFPPIQGAYPMALRDTVSGKDKVEFHFKTKQPAFIYIQDLGDNIGHLVTFPVESGRNYRLSYDGKAFSFIGDGQEAQRLYAALPYYGHPQMAAIQYLQDTDFATIKSKLDDVVARETAPFDSLYQAKGMSSGLHDLVVADREAYARLVMTNAGLMLTNRGRQELGEQLEQAAHDGLDLDSDRILATSAFYYLIERDADIQLMKRRDEAMQFVEAGQINTMYIDEYKKMLTGKRLEAAIGYQLFNAAIQKGFEKELLTLYDSFAQAYPDNRLLPELEPYIDEVRDYYSDRPADPDIIFMEDTDSIASLSDLLSRFTGKKVYIDVWATWCEPCKEEFAYSERLHGLLEEAGYEMLYISVDKPKDSEKWKEMVSFYDLKGSHVLTGEALNKDLFNVYGEDGSMAIPWNMIIDVQGNIVQLHAPRPSEYDALKAAL